MKKIAIIGAGFQGRACAQLFITAGYQVMISNSRGPQSLISLPSAIPGCQVGTQEEAAAFADLILIVIPFSEIKTLSASMLAGKVIMDANNYYPHRDGQIAALDERHITTSEIVARHLTSSQVVKAFSAILSTDLVKDAQPAPGQPRRALPVASDHSEAKAQVTALHEEVGYDVVDVGGLAESWRFERAKPAYCRPFNSAGLRSALADAERNVELPHGSWR